MAKGRVRNRMELRADYEAAEAREAERRKSAGADGAEEEAEEADEPAAKEAPAPAKKKKKAAAPKEPKPKRTRTPKVVRQRVVWVVFDNSNKRVGEVFSYSKRRDADELAAKLSAEKKSTFFVQPIKEAMED
jgi:hypothetical protein